MIRISICLSDIPESARKKSETNGKIYASFVVDKMKQADKFENTHTVYVNQTKEQREAKEPKQYVGNGKEYTFGGQAAATPQQHTDYNPSPENVDDLPF